MKQQTIGDILTKPLKINESDLASEMRERARKFDQYEKNEESEHERFYRCGHCNPEANLFPEKEVIWDDECGCFLCERCLKEEEEARDIIQEEEKGHHRENL